ncbi:MAG: LacI family DNA-binding transcriptional regulator [Verrucomicrobiota bacterium]|nr:LacI family DNA-binding transcriptional regulator [Verrucomicrobiota bacterium]
MKKKLTRKDIAKAAGVSPSTVSRALSDSELLPAKTIQMVKKVAAKMGYQPNFLARRLATNKSFHLGFVLPPASPRKGPLQVSYYSTLLDAVVTQADKRGYSVSVHPQDLGGKTMVKNCRELVNSSQLDGLVITGLTQDSEIPGLLKKRKIPFIVIGAVSENKKDYYVAGNPLPAIREMLNCLEDRGYKRLFFVVGNTDYYHARVQRDSLFQAIEESSINLEKVLYGNYSRRSGYHAAASIHSQEKNRPGDCVFLSNDRMACGYYRYCYENSIVIPDEIGLIGSDNDEEAFSLFPQLCTISQSRMEMGREAVNLLIDKLEKKKGGKRSLLLPKTFLFKESL